ncbi:hypothetical protein HXS80_15880 [Streptomyces sp. CB04723]|uniref:hypothetical protein n=1 Tax=Streptomyces TaxID=1883 RepID=UPI0015C4E66D|nr:hypothetical protein [Streptomyces sp. CB04723]QLG33008.1 hypothetical protein HXS80_15880 [Streptomyces sp. CB04723]
MAEFEVLQVDVKTGNVVTPLPVTGVGYTETLNAAGTCSVGVPLDAANPGTLEPGRSGLVVVRDGVPEWGGPVWTASADLDAGVLTLNAAGWHSYYAARYLSAAGGYTGTKDQTQLVRDWIGYANTNGGIGTVTTGLTNTGRVRTRKWGFSEFKNIAEAINELADEDGGFDFQYETFWADGTRTRVGNRFTKTARLSRTFPALTHGVDANVTQVAYDGSRLASRAYAFGADLGTGVKPYASSVNELGTPTLHQVVTYADLRSTGELIPKAGALGAVGRQVIAIPTLDLYPGVYRPGVHRVGAHGMVNVDSGYVQLLEEYVISERQVSVDVNGTETATLSLASKEVFVSGDSG